MLDPKILDDISKRLNDALPVNLKALQGDLEKNLHAAVQSVFSRLDLVSREEFDVQSRVLARSREKTDQLEQQLAELESRILKK